MILVIDNYDSFTFNLVQALEAAGADLAIYRNDRLDAAELSRMVEAPQSGRPLRGMLISPGPGNPETAGISVEAIRCAAERGVPVLGVCLGLQCLAAAFGARIVRAPSLVHGEASDVYHDGEGLLAGLPSPFPAGRYHSLCVDRGSLPPELEVSAQTADGVVMALRHRRWPLEGVQFHPESILTPDGPLLLANFLRRTEEGDPAILDAAGAGGFAAHGLGRRRPGGSASVAPDGTWQRSEEPGGRAAMEVTAR